MIPSIRKAFVDAGYETKKDDSAVTHGNIFLVVIDCNLYRIEDDYSWERCEENVYVAGSGEALALGAMSYAMTITGSILTEHFSSYRFVLTDSVCVEI